MSLPPALLARLAQRGLVNKQKSQKENEPPPSSAENEEVIAEDYDEMDSEPLTHHNSEDYQYPTQYDLDHDMVRKPVEDNNWLSQMKTRMGEASSAAGYKCCPNKYNIWHKCTLYCVNRWSEGIQKPSPEYMKRYRRLTRKYPLPKGWVEMYDPGCGCYYFACEADNVVSWLPPTHPKSVITKSAATVRKQMEESSGETAADSDAEDQSGEENELNAKESAQSRHQREVDEIINASLRSKSPRTLDPHEFPTLQEANESPSVAMPRKQKSRDLDRALSRQRKDRGGVDRDRDREWADRDRDRERDWSDRDRGERDHNDRNNRMDRERSERDRGDRGDRGDRYSGYRRPYNKRPNDSEKLDPMDPSSYSDIPRGKWSDGLQTGSGEGKGRNEESRRGKAGENRGDKRRSPEHSANDNEEDDDDDDDDDGGEDDHNYR